MDVDRDAKSSTQVISACLTSYHTRHDRRRRRRRRRYQGRL